MVKLLLDVINHVPTLAPVLMVVWMIMRMVGPVAMIVRVHSACWWQLLRAMGMLSIYMIWMIVSKPAIFGVIVSNQQAFAMMPAITEDIIVLLAFGGLLIFAQTIPLAMRMLFQLLRKRG